MAWEDEKVPENHFAVRGGELVHLVYFALFGFSGFFGFAEQEKQDKPNKLDKLAWHRRPPTRRS